MIFKNKGEWSELYVAFKFLAEGKMDNADENGLKTGDSLEVTKIFREDITYIRNTRTNLVEIYQHGRMVKGMSFGIFGRMSMLLFTYLRMGRNRPEIQELLLQNPKNKQGYPIPEVEEFMGGILMTTVSQSAAHKADIEFEIKDVHTGSKNRVAYSIKSNYKGSPPTLINASEATNFVYRLPNMNDAMMETINSINTST